MNDDVTTPAKKGFPWGWIAVLIAVISLVAAANYFRGTVCIYDRQSRTGSDLDAILTILRLYVSEYGALPDGDNDAVWKALRGENPRQIEFCPKTSASTGKELGVVLDPWGTPYQIDTSDRKSPRVYSFGKNRIDEGGAEGSDDVVSWR